MKTVWQQKIHELAVEFFNQAVDEEFQHPENREAAFQKYYIAALLGEKDAAFHVAMAFEVGLGVKQSERLARYWYESCG